MPPKHPSVLESFAGQYGHLKKHGLIINGLVEIDYFRQMNVIDVSYPPSFDTSLLPETFSGLTIRANTRDPFPNKALNSNFDFEKTSLPPSRPADFYLTCLGGAVFIDFNETDEGLIYPKRISFDGYGCCKIKKPVPMKDEDSQVFRLAINEAILNQQLITSIVLKILEANRDQLWEDAIKEYGLLSQTNGDSGLGPE